jgi:carbamoyl-phosphate synthase large subunit
VNDRDKPELLPIARKLGERGFTLVGTRGTAQALSAEGLKVESVFKVNEGRPHVVDLIKTGKIQLIINTPLGRKSFYDERAIRRAAVRHRVPCITTLEGATAAVAGVEALQKGEIEIICLQDLYPRFEARSSVRAMRVADPATGARGSLAGSEAVTPVQRNPR